MCSPPTPWVQTPPLFVPNGVPPLEEGPDPFDPESLRLPQDFVRPITVKRALLTVPVKKPPKEWFVRVHPDPAYHLQTALIRPQRSPRKSYLVARLSGTDLAGEVTFTSKMMFLAINRQKVLFFWPIRFPGPEGRSDNWSKSALDAAQLAMTGWVRVTSDTSLGAYQVCYAEYTHEPVWPDLPMQTLLRVAFKDHYIDTLDHPMLAPTPRRGLSDGPPTAVLSRSLVRGF